ncbi:MULTISPECIES: cytochrome P450 [unclassified Sinorhizobium]|uniref:cytochrome P450 n=1 Tax=unclassified Sinorhizobium TaxID=2613772 RepID=UPI003523A6E3
MTDLASAPQTEGPVSISVSELDVDPHGIYRRYRSRTPVLRREDGVYLALRAADIQSLMTDPRTRQMETELVALRGVTSGALFNFFRYNMLFSNGTDHTRRRSPMTRTFAFRMIAELRPRLRALADDLLDQCYSQGEMDFLEGFAAAIPAHTIAAILGMPDADIQHFTSSVYVLSKALSGSWTIADIPEFDKAAGDLYRYVSDLIEDRRKNPREDFLSTYVQAVDRAGDLSSLEAVTQIVTVVLGGSDTTRAAMAMQVAILLQHREQWETICQDEGWIPAAVSEALRFEPSVASVPRFTLTEIEIGDQTIPAGRAIALVTMAAMRDPELYADPDTFDIFRKQPRWHLAFGGSAHRCLGEALARAELEEGLAALTARLPHLRILGDRPVLKGHAGIRQISDMRVAWS